MKRPRRIFGRRSVQHDTASYRIELRNDGLYIRRKFSRKIGWKKIGFDKLVLNYEGQGTFGFL